MKQREQQQREHHADAEEEGERFLAAIAGLHEAQPEAPISFGERGTSRRPLDEADKRDHAGLRFGVASNPPP